MVFLVSLVSTLFLCVFLIFLNTYYVFILYTTYMCLTHFWSRVYVLRHRYGPPRIYIEARGPHLGACDTVPMRVT